MLYDFLTKLIHGQHRTHKKLEEIMATLAEVQAASQAVTDAVTKLGADVVAAIQALQQGSGVNPADLDPIVAGLTAAGKSLTDSATALEAALPKPAP